MTWTDTKGFYNDLVTGGVNWLIKPGRCLLRMRHVQMGPLAKQPSEPKMTEDEERKKTNFKNRA